VTFSDLFKVMIIQCQITWTTYSYTYNGRPIESRIWSIERQYFQWSWMTLTPSFNVTPFFDAEYLRNGTTYRPSVIEILIGTYTCPMCKSRIRGVSRNALYKCTILTYLLTLCNSVILSDIEWLSKIFNDMKRHGLSATAERLVYTAYYA